MSTEIIFAKGDNIAPGTKRLECVNEVDGFHVHNNGLLMKHILKGQKSKIIEELVDLLKSSDEFVIRRNPSVIKTDSDKDVIVFSTSLDYEELVRCGECSKKYAKDFDYYCPHMKGPIKPWGFCWKGTKGENHETD